MNVNDWQDYDIALVTLTSTGGVGDVRFMKTNGEVVEVADELAGKMADMTIGVNEDEIAEAQETVHAIRVLKAQRREQKALLEAEKRRIEFALDELKYD